MKYIKQFGSYYLYEELPPESGHKLSSVPLNMCDQVAMGFVRLVSGGAVLHKHGSPEAIKHWFDTSRQKYIERGFPEMAAELGMVVLPPDFDVDEINRCLSTTGYVGRVIEQIEKVLGDGQG